MVAKVKKHIAEAEQGLSMKAEEPLAAAGEPEAELVPEVDRAEDLQAKLEEAVKKAADNYDKYVRSVAELDNYKKRAVREKADAIQYGNENLLRDILPLVDGMDRALEHACNSEDFDAFRKGLKLLQGQLLGCLQKHGVEMIDTAGKNFDPNVHEAMMQVESTEHEESGVVGEFERGYLLNGRLLRPAKVSVCKRPSGSGDRENNCEEAKNN
ncbi:MAG: nucleotide exchange factor GrpE [Syntrophales bacterium]